MGAEQFFVKRKGKTAKEAFDEAVADAQYEEGHGGYTGTIAEKNEFKEVFPNEGESAKECAERHSDTTFDDKWGPAGCIKLQSYSDGNHLFLFFGWASS